MMLVFLGVFAIKGMFDHTCGGVYMDTDDGALSCHTRSTLLGFGAVVCMVAFVLVRIPCLSPRDIEVVCVFAACAVVAVVALEHPHYLLQIVGAAGGAGVLAGVTTDAWLVMHLEALLVATHILLPIRWYMLLFVRSFMVVLVLLLTLLCGSPDRLASMLSARAILFMLLIAASMGKRALEKHERAQFEWLASERVLRAQAEHKLDKALASDGSGTLSGSTPTCGVGGAAPDTASNGSGITGDVFHIRGCDADSDAGCGRVCERLEQIRQLGLKEHWLIRHEDLQPCPGRILGQGMFGLVMGATYHGAEVALKLPRRGRAIALSSVASVVEELRVFRRLRHPNIVDFYGACIDPKGQDILLVMELVHGRPLNDVVLQAPAPSLAEAEVRCRLADDICCALVFLHAQTPTVIHGDIKPSNVLVESLCHRFRARLLDFGLSRVLSCRVRLLGGTMRWMAPEVVLQQQRSVAPSADVFSFGRLLYFIMTGCSPLADASENEVMVAAANGRSMALCWPEGALLDSARDLCERCYAFEAQKRPTALAAQRELRSWRPDFFGDKPPEALDFAEALTRAHSRNLDERPVGLEGSRAPGPASSLQHPAFLETEERGKMISVAQALCSWNLNVRPKDCCSFHVAARDLSALASRLVDSPCKPLIPPHNGQCPECLLMRSATAGPMPDGVCYTCGFGCGQGTADDANLSDFDFGHRPMDFSQMINLSRSEAPTLGSIAEGREDLAEVQATLVPL